MRFSWHRLKEKWRVNIETQTSINFKKHDVYRKKIKYLYSALSGDFIQQKLSYIFINNLFIYL